MNKRGVSADDRLPKFFKVYLPDESGNDLDLPISFNSFLPKPLPRNVIVRSIYGNVWKMAFRKCCGDIEKFAIVNGWKRIIKDEDLKGGEFLEFEFDGSRLFNFCIYGHATCKKLRSSVQNREVRDESRGEYDISSDDITFLDDDDGDIGDVNDGQDYGDEDKSSENIIVIDDDDDDGNVQDYNEEDKSSKEIIVIDDDDDSDNDDVKSYGEEDKTSEDIIVGDDDDDQGYGDDEYADDENERRRGVETERKVKGYFGVSKKSNNENDRQYLDNDMNPYFTVNQNFQTKKRSGKKCRVPAKVIKDYALQFPKFINLSDPSGKLMRKVEGHTIKGFESIITRNKVRRTDKMICELEMEMNGLVRIIKVHVIR